MKGLCLTCALLGLLLSGVVRAQPALPAFDVASIKANLSGNPDLLELEIPRRPFPGDECPSPRFGELPLGAAPPHLKRLLEERFKLRIRIDEREMPIYELTLARDDRTLGPSLRRPARDVCAEIARLRSERHQHRRRSS